MTGKYRAALISMGSQSSKKTSEAMRKYFESVDDVEIRDIEIVLGHSPLPFYRGEQLPSYDCVYIKGSYKYASIAKSVATLLHDTCYMPIHAGAFTTVHNKLLTHLELQRANIPMPKTYLVATQNAGKKLLREIPYPIIIKIPEGTHGVGVMFADSFAAASSVMDTLSTLKQPFIIQEYIETQGEDVRAIVVGDRVVAAMKRRASGGEVRSNFHSGGAVEHLNVSAQTRKLCVQVAKILKADICGIDLLEGPKGPLVIEANISPGLKGIMSTTSLDLADELAAFMFAKTDEFIEARNRSKPTSTTLLQDMGIDVAESPESTGQIVTQFDMRGNRVLLPEFITHMSGLKEGDDYVVVAEKNHVNIKKM